MFQVLDIFIYYLQYNSAYSLSRADFLSFHNVVKAPWQNCTLILELVCSRKCCDVAKAFELKYVNHTLLVLVYNPALFGTSEHVKDLMGWNLDDHTNTQKRVKNCSYHIIQTYLHMIKRQYQ